MKKRHTLTIPLFMTIIMSFVTGCATTGVIVHDGFDLPEQGHYNLATLQYYFKRYNYSNRRGYTVPPSKNVYEFETELRDDKHVLAELEKTALVSYLLFENNKIVVDHKSPDGRFGALFDDNTQLISNSEGKGIVGYALAHAICEGYISGIDEKMIDYPLIENTLYEDQPILNLLNMAGGDQLYVNNHGFIGTRFSVNGETISTRFLQSNPTKNKLLKTNARFNYNNLQPNLVANYIAFKMGAKKYEVMMARIWNKAGNENTIFMSGNRYTRYSYGSKANKGVYRHNFSASRYDYLRIARAIMEDWNNNTCEGELLKEMYTKRIKRNYQGGGHFNHYTGYGAFFHTDMAYTKDRKIIALDGYGGQMIVIDLDRKRIVATNAVHLNYNWRKIVTDPIKNGV